MHLFLWWINWRYDVIDPWNGNVLKTFIFQIGFRWLQWGYAFTWRYPSGMPGLNPKAGATNFSLQSFKGFQPRQTWCLTHGFYPEHWFQTMRRCWTLDQGILFQWLFCQALDLIFGILGLVMKWLISAHGILSWWPWEFQNLKPWILLQPWYPCHPCHAQKHHKATAHPDIETHYG